MSGLNSLGERPDQWRAAYDDAVGWFVSVVSEVDVSRLGGPGLGEWTLRDLVGHTSRSLVTVMEYLGAEGEVEVASAAAYFRAASAIPPASVADRGRAAGAALGADVVGAVGELADRVRSALSAAGDEALVASPLGVMTLAEYLPTRTFELAVHGCDVAAAAGLPLAVPATAGESAGRLVAALLGERAGEVLLALTGRRALPEGFSVLA